MSQTPPTSPDAPPTGEEVRAMTAATGRLIDRFVSRADFDRHRRNVRLALVGVLAAGVLLVVVIGVIVVAVFKLGDVTSSNRDVIDEVRECITPSPRDGDGRLTPDGRRDPHECYDDGERRTAEALATIAASFDRSADRIIDRIDELEDATP